MNMDKRWSRTELGKFLAGVVIFIGLFSSIHAADGAVRLRDGTGYTGRVEVEFNSLYGTVCADNFNIEDAHVVCRQLGFHYGALKIVRAADSSFGIGTLPINVHDVNCAGDEASLVDCPGFMGNGSCSQSEATAVFCALPYYEGCYSDPGTSLWGNDDGTLDGLINECRAFQYDIAASSSQLGTFHRCYNGEPTGTLVDDSQCGVVCVKDRNQLCGGTGDVRAVYSTLLGANGYSMASDNGTITSPMYPAITTTDDYQVWMVTLSSVQEIEFTFPVFDIDAQDVLTIEAGGVNETFNSGRSWTSNPTSSFRVFFDTDSTSSNGFILNYEAFTAEDPQTTTLPPTTAPPVTTSGTNVDPTTAGGVNPTTAGDVNPTTADDSATTAGAVPVTTLAPVPPTEEPTTAPVAPPAPPGRCPVDVGSVESSWLQRDAGGLLILNTGQPLPCRGTVVRVSYYAVSTGAIEVGIWRRMDSSYELLDATLLIAGTSPSPVTKRLDFSLAFEQGDFLGFSFDTISPVVFDYRSPEATEHTIFPYSSLGNYPGLGDGGVLQVTNASEVLVVRRAYSLQVSIEDTKCTLPSILNGMTSPGGADVLQGVTVTLECNSGYEPAYAESVCFPNGSFSNPFQCDEIPVTYVGLTQTHFIMLLVGVGVLGLLLVFTMCYVVCCTGKAKAPSTNRDMADGAAGGNGEAYLLPGAPMDGHGNENGVANTSFIDSSTKDVESGHMAQPPSPPPPPPPQAYPDPNANQIFPKADPIPNGDYPNHNAPPETIPEVPEEPPAPSVPEVNAPEQPEIPPADYDADEVVPSPPASPPPPPPPEYLNSEAPSPNDDDHTSAVAPTPYHSPPPSPPPPPSSSRPSISSSNHRTSPPPSPPASPVSSIATASPVDDMMAERPSAVLPQQDVLY